MTPTRELAIGKWRGLLPQLGIDSKYLRNKHGPCPICGGKDRFRFDDTKGTGSWICSQCGSGDGFDLVQRKLGLNFSELSKRIKPLVGGVVKMVQDVQVEDEAVLKERMKRLWAAGRPVHPYGVVATYLRSRVGRVWLSNSIREVSNIRHPNSDQRFNAMIARITDVDGGGANIHITYLDNNGNKAPVSPVKRVMKGKLPDGCAIRLGKPAELMGIAEGIETAISASIIHGVPVWAAINGAMMAKWIPPEEVNYINIYADNDVNYTGLAKAYTLANRLCTQYHIRAEVIYPHQIGYDWCDTLGDYISCGEYFDGKNVG